MARWKAIDSPEGVETERTHLRPCIRAVTKKRSQSRRPKPRHRNPGWTPTMWTQASSG